MSKMTDTEGTGGQVVVVVTRPPADPRKWPSWLRSFPGGHLLVLRAFLGVTFCYAGLQKLASRGFFQASNPGSIQAQLRASARTTPVGHLIAPVDHLAVLIGLVIAFGEIAAGLGTLLGLYARVAATGGMLIAVSFFLTVSYNTSPYYYGSDIVFAFAWTTLALNGAGALSVDGYFAQRRHGEQAETAPATPPPPRPPDTPISRRTAMAKLAAASFVGALALFFGGVAAAAGRALGRTTSITGPTFPTGSTTRKGGSGTTSTTAGGGTTGGGKPTGKLLGPATAVAVGSATGFTDPFQGVPAYVVQPKEGEFLAFSAVCTHAGCTVSFVPSAKEFQCPCHGSIYSALTGAVIQGPAQRPLPAIGIKVSGGDLYVTD